MASLITKDFDLAATVRSGHIFAYDEHADGSFTVCDGGKIFAVSQKANELRFFGVDKDEVIRFFDLDLDVGALHRRLGRDPVLRNILLRYKGIRLVRQDLRQAILTFILSSNNNQKRIKGMVDRFRKKHGERVGGKHLFPQKTKITSLKDIDDLGFGYRAAFIAATEKKLTLKFLQTLKSHDYDDARELLLTLPGVGPKVADCVLAYSELAKGEAFPADVWVKCALEKWYPPYFRNKPLTDKNIQEFAKKKFGNDAAYAQHYLFLAAQELLREKEIF